MRAGGHSPPCQPYTRNGKRLDTDDPRAEPLLHLIDVLRGMAYPPAALVLENVEGFEHSESRRRLVDALAARGYSLQVRSSALRRLHPRGGSARVTPPRLRPLPHTHAGVCAVAQPVRSALHARPLLSHGVALPGGRRWRGGSGRGRTAAPAPPRTRRRAVRLRPHRLAPPPTGACAHRCGLGGRAGAATRWAPRSRWRAPTL